METDSNPSYVVSSPDRYKQSCDNDEAYDSLRQSSQLYGSLLEHDQNLNDATEHLYCSEDLNQGIEDDGDNDAFHNFYQNESNDLHHAVQKPKYCNLDRTTIYDEEANNQRSLFDTDMSGDLIPSLRAENYHGKGQNRVYQAEELQNLLPTATQGATALAVAESFDGNAESFDGNSRPHGSPSSSSSCSPDVERVSPYVLQSQLPIMSQCTTPTDSPVKDTKYKDKTNPEWITQTKPCGDGLGDIPQHLLNTPSEQPVQTSPEEASTLRCSSDLVNNEVMHYVKQAQIPILRQ